MDKFEIIQVLDIIEGQLKYNTNSSEYDFYLALKLQLEKKLKDLEEE